MPLLDRARDLLGEREIGRTAQLGYVGSPTCHDFTLRKLSSIDNAKMASHCLFPTVM
jgi:hypothetical protein